jgi:hypothetical protein
MNSMLRVRLFVLLWLSAVAASGCGSSSKKVSLGAGCVLNTDCDNPLACKFSKCHRACNESRDCDPGQRCVKVDGIGVCQLPAEATFVCGSSGACAQPLVCGPDNRCRNSCTVKTDCIGTQTCMTDLSSGTSVCADTNETLTPTDGGATGGAGGGTDGGTGSGGAGDGGTDTIDAGTHGFGCVSAVHGRYVLRTDGKVLRQDGLTAIRDSAAAPLANATSVCDGSAHGCAVLADGTVSCWPTTASGNDSGQLGNGTITAGTLNRASQVLVAIGEPLTQATSVAQAPVDYYAQTTASCAVAQTGKLYCWGDLTWIVNGGKALSSGYAQAITTDGLHALTGVLQAALSENSACAVVQGPSSNEVWCWGQNNYSNLGLGDTTLRQYPTKVLGLTNPTKVTISAHGNGGYRATTCALDGGGVRCWGWDGTEGETGTNNSGTAGIVIVPTLVTTFSGVPLDGIVDLEGGGDEDGYLNGHPTCALRNDKSLWCWGASYKIYAANYGITNVASVGYATRNPRFLTTDGVYHNGMTSISVKCDVLQ